MSTDSRISPFASRSLTLASSNDCWGICIPFNIAVVLALSSFAPGSVKLLFFALRFNAFSTTVLACPYVSFLAAGSLKYLSSSASAPEPRLNFPDGESYHPTILFVSFLYTHTRPSSLPIPSGSLMSR